jgi:hypothetical protein
MRQPVHRPTGHPFGQPHCQGSRCAHNCSILFLSHHADNDVLQFGVLLLLRLIRPGRRGSLTYLSFSCSSMARIYCHFLLTRLQPSLRQYPLHWKIKRYRSMCPMSQLSTLKSAPGKSLPLLHVPLRCLHTAQSCMDAAVRSQGSRWPAHPECRKLLQTATPTVLLNVWTSSRANFTPSAVWSDVFNSGALDSVGPQKANWTGTFLNATTYLVGC